MHIQIFWQGITATKIKLTHLKAWPASNDDDDDEEEAEAEAEAEVDKPGTPQSEHLPPPIHAPHCQPPTAQPHLPTFRTFSKP